jgi:hypothetical protein
VDSRQRPSVHPQLSRRRTPRLRPAGDHVAGRRPDPPDAREFTLDEERVAYAYELDVDLLTIYYTVMDHNNVAIQAVTWRVI